MNYQKPSQIAEIGELSNNFKIINNLEIIEASLIVIIIIDLLVRVVNYMTV